MLLTGPEIKRLVKKKEIVIEPFVAENINPNSYNFRLGKELARVARNCEDGIDTSIPSVILPQRLDSRGRFLLMPGCVYLGHTEEVIGSTGFVPKLDGRSTTGRHGLAIHVTAGFGDLGFIGQWVLEIVNMTGEPLFIKPGVRIGQVSFEPTIGEKLLYTSGYQQQRGIVSAKALS